MRTFLFFSIVILGQRSPAQVLGSVEGSGKCTSPSEVFVAQGKKLLFQIHVPVGGTFEVKLNPGKYELTALNQDECSSSVPIELKKEQLNVTLAMSALSDVKRKPNFYSEMAGRSQLGYFPQYGSYYPWWQPWSMYMYPGSYNYPCMWAMWGCQSRMYPSGGPIAMGKPNLYIVGPDIKEAKIELERIETHKLMATAPAHMEKGWTFSLEKNQIKVNGTPYPYLFYDSRAELDRLPNQSSGFCGNRSEILGLMKKELYQFKFPENAVADFDEHWMVKLPPISQFCVYPQINEQMDKAAPIKTSLKDSQMTRVLFFIVPKTARRGLPREAYLKELVQRQPAEWKTPVIKKASAKWAIYEWGVAFPFEK